MSTHHSIFGFNHYQHLCELWNAKLYFLVVRKWGCNREIHFFVNFQNCRMSWKLLSFLIPAVCSQDSDGYEDNKMDVDIDTDIVICRSARNTKLSETAAIIVVSSCSHCNCAGRLYRKLYDRYYC